MPDVSLAIDGHTTTTPRLNGVEVAVITAVTAGMLAATALELWPIGWMEVVGFATGGVCVWMIVREHMLNWPIGLANNVVFFILFYNSRLFADAYLQLAYFGLGVYGWWHWLRGGERQTELRVSHAPPLELALLLALSLPVTWALRELLVAVNGAAPVWDALTTVLSLVAQVLTCRKRIESWYVWMTVDVIYIPLYLSRQLPLTAVLYGVFLIMCFVGWRQWNARHGGLSAHER